MNTCGHCCTANPAAAKFCMGCGTSLAQASAPAGLRFVTVAFCDISGSTQLALRFDPQVWHGILETYFAQVGGALVAAGGRLEKFIGDAVVGVFGADAAGEDDAANAVAGALGALERLEARNEDTIGRYGIRLSIRFGIASGRVVMADRDSSFAIGSVMNRAARLQAAAPADGCVVDVRTWLLVRDRYRCAPVDPVPAKGFSRMLQAWSVSAEPATGSWAPPFVNQAPLLDELTAAVTSAATSPGVSTIALSGEMGSGKSRILHRLAGEVGDWARVVRVSCHRDDQEQGIWRLEQIERELGLPVTRGAGTPSTQELQWRLRRRMADLSADRPLVMLIDDYDRSPTALRELLDLPPSGSGPLVFVVAGREPIPAPVTLRIPSLSDEHSYELLSTVHGEVEMHSVAALEPLVERGRGNPLFLEQLAALAGDGIDDEVPPSAEAALGARIDRLAPPVRHVLACLGAWGRGLRPGDLDAVCDLDEDELTACLAELERLGLAGNQTAAEVAYAHLVLGERARVHAAIARRLQEYARTDPALLDAAVAHADRAQRYARELDPGSEVDAAATRLAAQCLIAAARQAISRSEVRAGADLAARARALDIPDPALTLEIAALESYCLSAAGRAAEALERITEVAGLTGNIAAEVHLGVTALALGHGDPAEVRALAAAGGDPGASARLDAWDGVQAARAGDYPRAEALLRSAYARMRTAGANLSTAEIYGNLSLFLTCADTEVREAARQCLALRDEVTDTPILHAVVGCSAALLLQRRGDGPAAVRLVDEARSVFGEMGHVVGQAGAEEFASMVAELAGDLGAARDAACRAEQIFIRAGAGAQAQRARLRAFVLDPATVDPPDLAEVAVNGSWEQRVTRTQAAALLATDRHTALDLLDQALTEIRAIKGGGATLLPLAACLRIARHWEDTPRMRLIRDALMRIAPLWS